MGLYGYQVGEPESLVEKKCWINCMIELDFYEAYLLSIY